MKLLNHKTFKAELGLFKAELTMKVTKNKNHLIFKDKI